MTKSRLTIFNCLQQSTSPLPITVIVKQCPAINRTSVYRTLELFSELHIVTTVPHGWKHAYELSDPFQPHHHHFHCTQCRKSTSLQSSTVEKMVDELAASLKADVTSHTFEIHGICHQCRRLTLR